jgi:P4 family phage/plasmid primase-like protien
LLNIVSELPEADILDSESWKAMVAGDTTTGREIRKEPFSFKPVAGHVYSANRLPGTTDQSHGFWRRLLVVQFNRVFAEREQDPDLADRIVQSDHRAVVAWALIGASRVLKIGHYTVPRSSAKALDKWRAHADQVRAFVDDWTSRLLPDEPLHMGTQAEVLYKAYRTWAQENGHRPVASNTFGERMCLLGLGSKSDGFVRRHPVRLERTVEHGD